MRKRECHGFQGENRNRPSPRVSRTPKSSVPFWAYRTRNNSRSGSNSAVTEFAPQLS